VHSSEVETVSRPYPHVRRIHWMGRHTVYRMYGGIRFYEPLTCIDALRLDFMHARTPSPTEAQSVRTRTPHRTTRLESRTFTGDMSLTQCSLSSLNLHYLLTICHRAARHPVLRRRFTRGRAQYGLFQQIPRTWTRPEHPKSVSKYTRTIKSLLYTHVRA
jgi:hypothetical protein